MWFKSELQLHRHLPSFLLFSSNQQLSPYISPPICLSSKIFLVGVSFPYNNNWYMTMPPATTTFQFFHQLTHTLNSCSDLLNLVQHAVAGRQIAVVGQLHLLYIRVIEVAPLKIQHRSLHDNVRYNTPVQRERGRQQWGEEKIWGLFTNPNGNCIALCQNFRLLIITDS